MNHNEKSDNDLMKEFSGCSFKAYEEIVQRYKHRLFNFLLCGLINDRDAAEDIVQETLIRVYKSKFTYKLSGQFSTWAYTICKNLALNEKRDNKRSIDLDTAFSCNEPEQPGERVDQTVENEEISEIMRKILLKIDKKYSSVITLRYIEELPYQEISQITGLGVNTLKSHCKRGLETIRKEMEILKIEKENLYSRN